MYMLANPQTHGSHQQYDSGAFMFIGVGPMVRQ
jgi:hypothetical protein